MINHLLSPSKKLTNRLSKISLCIFCCFIISMHCSDQRERTVTEIYHMLCVVDFADVCSSFPCMNGGRCEPAGGAYICHCRDRYRGQSCEIDKDPCQRQPCLNGGRSCVFWLFIDFDWVLFVAVIKGLGIKV